MKPPHLTVRQVFHGYALACSAAFLAVTPLSWISRELGAFRNWQTGFTVLFLGALAASGWLQRPTPVAIDPRVVRALFGCALVAFVGCQLSRYYAFEVNGYDFSIFDLMLYNSAHRTFMTTPLYGVSDLGIHQSYVMILLIPAHLLFEHPLFLVLLNAVILWAAAVPLWRLAVRSTHPGLGLLLVLAYWTNPWIGPVLDGGFHVENLYPLLGLSFVWGWTARRTRIWVLAAALFLAVKEDGGLYLSGFAVAAAAVERPRWRSALGLLAASAAVLWVDLGWVQPWLLKGYPIGELTYARWSAYGRTAPEILLGLAASPGKVVRGVLGSAWRRFFGPALFLPFASLRASAAMLPAIVMLGSASYDMMQHYRWYYPMPLVPFFFWGLLEGRQRLARTRLPPRALELLFTGILLTYPLIGGGYMKFGPPSWQTLGELPDLRRRLAAAHGPVCVQAILFPYLPYPLDLRPLSAACVRLPGALAVMNPFLDADPQAPELLQGLVARARARGEATELPAGFVLAEDAHLFESSLY